MKNTKTASESEKIFKIVGTCQLQRYKIIQSVKHKSIRNIVVINSGSNSTTTTTTNNNSNNN